MTSVMVLCAGYGLRLRPLTEELPKPLLPVGDAPMLAHICHALSQHGLREVVVNTHHLPDKFAGFFGALPVGVQVQHEPEILGTAGALRRAAAIAQPPLLLWNGDTCADPDLTRLLAGSSASDTLCLTIKRLAPGLGPLGIDAAGNLCRLRGEVFGPEVSGGDYLGIGLFGSEAVDHLPVKGCVIGDLCLPWLRAGKRIRTLIHDGFHFDIGTLDGYFDANYHWLEQRSLPRYLGAQSVTTQRVERSIVGRAAYVEAPLTGCIVWPGARVSRALRRAVVTTAGRIVLAV